MGLICVQIDVCVWLVAQRGVSSLTRSCGRWDVSSLYLEMHGNDGEHKALQVLHQVVECPEALGVLAALYVQQATNFATLCAAHTHKRHRQNRESTDVREQGRVMREAANSLTTGTTTPHIQ